MTSAVFLALLFAVLAWGGWLGQRLARANTRIDRDVRGEEICIEAERCERGLFMDWRI